MPLSGPTSNVSDSESALMCIWGISVSSSFSPVDVEFVGAGELVGWTKLNASCVLPFDRAVCGMRPVPLRVPAGQGRDDAAD